MRIKNEAYGESVILHLSFTTDEGVASNKMKKGQWVIIYGEIPARKLTGDKFAVYPNCTAIEVKSIEEKTKRAVNSLNDYVRTNDLNLDVITRYVKQGRKTKRQHYWDAPAYF